MWQKNARFIICYRQNSLDQMGVTLSQWASILNRAIMTYKAFQVEIKPDGSIRRGIVDKRRADLPDNDVLVRVQYSSLNYKDALSASGNKGVTRKYPHTPGIDAAGVVVESKCEDFSDGDEVIVTSYDLGMNTAGGFAEYIRVPAEWVVPLPAGLSLFEAMVYGTAGFTAGLSVSKIVDTIKPDDGEVVVTGGTGGVGSVAIAILAHLGYSVVAVSGKPEAGAFLQKLGAVRMISRDSFLEGVKKPLLKVEWAGGIDTVGGELLEVLVKSTGPSGVVTCCGNVASPELTLNVYPFILRGVSLMGIDSQNCPMGPRRLIWRNLATIWKIPQLKSLVREVDLEGVEKEIQTILLGGQKGRIVVRVGS